MKTFLTSAIASALLMVSLAAHAGYDDTGIIRNVTPIQTEQQQQQQICDGGQMMVTSSQQRPGMNAGSIIGGIAGALLGNQVGGGSGRMAATAIGAAAGAMTGDRVASRNQEQYNTQQQPSCRWVQTTVPRISGYLVTFEYNGRTYQNTMAYDPSQGGTNNSIRVGVTVSAR